MTLEEALDEAIRVFFDDEESDELEVYKDSPDDNKYTKKYFDSVEEELIPSSEKQAPKKGVKL